MATAAIGGTVVSTTLRESDIVAGGKTIVITLSGDTWVAAGATFDAQRQNIINGLNSDGSETNGWNNVVRAGLAVTAVVRTNNSVCTITLSAFASYNITSPETITVTIPSTALLAGVAIVGSPTFQSIPIPWTFYVRKTGSDSNFGTTTSSAWLTFAKALGAAGVTGGDTVYIGAGVYREAITIAMTSATSEVKIYGDVDGSHTGDAGEIQWTGYTTNDTTAPNASALITLSARDFLTFQDIVFIGSATTMITGASSTSTDITFRRCLFVSAQFATQIIMVMTTAANTASNWVIDSCIFVKGTGAAFAPTLTRPATADFDYNIIIKNCLFIGSSGTCINILSTGANTFNGGGILVYNCSNISSGAFMVTSSANLSTTVPCKVYNCFGYSGVNALSATSSGQIIEDYNILLAGSGATPRSNVTAGAHSISDSSIAPLFFTGHEAYSVGSNLMPFGMPKPGSPLLGFGNQAATVTVDILGAARPSGFVKLGNGTATAGAALTLTDSGQTWGTNSFVGCTVKIISGTGSGQTKTINANTATVLTVDGNWKTNPSTDSVYEIYLRAMSSTGTATAGTTTTLTDSNAIWGANMWQGYTLTIDSGTGSGQTLVVTSNTATALTFATATAPANDSTYSLFRGTNVNTINAGVGAYEYGQSGNQNTATVRSGTSSYQIPGAGYVDFQIPVNAVATTISIYAQYDAAYSGTLPSMNIVNSTQCGVAAATATQVGAASTWEQLTLSFTPTAAGIVTVRLISSTTTPTGNAFFDDFNTV